MTVVQYFGYRILIPLINKVNDSNPGLNDLWTKKIKVKEYDESLKE